MKAAFEPRQNGLPGATWTPAQTIFSLRSLHATAVELCLFDSSQPNHESNRLALERLSTDLWVLSVPGVRPGQLYGFRVHGPWDPAAGHRFNPSKLLMDPAARALTGDLHWNLALFGSRRFESDDLQNLEDSAPYLPRSVVVDSSFDWRDDRPPSTPWQDSIVYECHVKGMTRLHPEVPPRLRGTYLGLVQEPILQHFKSLGVTAVELLPVQHSISEEHLVRRGLVNYFGYNPIGLSAPPPGDATPDDGDQVREFKEMVRGLHASGIEVLLDVVFNHTAEGNHLGPTLNLRGIDNSTYYRLVPEQPRYYQDFSGCGNTLDSSHSMVVELFLDCLRTWVTEMHVDGFRFDLATSVGRTTPDFDRAAPFFEALESDAVLSRVKLIAEPWDLGPEGYRLGQFPPSWSEWNDTYRDRVRAFWRGDPATTSGFRTALSGSPDVFVDGSRPARASINYVTSHDGFTLRDLVSYEDKNNWANGEDNRDGHDHNLSRNWGCEGPTQSEPIRTQRLRVQRCFLASLALSLGVPMLSHGDELGRTQQGNNNPYCHDSPQTWIDWELDSDRQEILDFTRLVLAARREIGLPAHGALPPADSLVWISLDGTEIHCPDWNPMSREPFGLLWPGTDRIALALFNNDSRGHLFEMPETGRQGSWRQLLNTTTVARRRLRGHAVRLAPHSVVLLVFEPRS